MFEKRDETTELPVPSVSEPTKEDLENFAKIHREDYEDFKKEFIHWLLRCGKKPFKNIGYAEDTAQTTHYKTDQIYRWKWEQEGEFTKEFTPDDAEKFIDMLVSETTFADREVRDFIKTIKRLFKWRSDKGGVDHDWSYSKTEQLQQQGISKRRHYFETHEMSQLYEAAIEENAVKSYHNVSPEERDKLKTHLSQRFGKPKSEIGPDDFERANSWKFPALIAASIDLAFRPIEIKRSNTRWLRLHEKKVVIPKDESSKGEETWECVLSERSAHALQRWLKERQSYEKYEDTDAIWLTKYGNPYTADSLNDLLGRLLSKTDISPGTRDLTWYSIRRGSATMWANNSGIDKAKEQLRHKKLETTLQYATPGTRSRREIASENW
jgi:site-specific recombinase XerD